MRIRPQKVVALMMIATYYFDPFLSLEGLQFLFLFCWLIIIETLFMCF